MITQVQRPPSTNGADKRIRRVLIFDNHPDSLRLLFGQNGLTNAYASDPQPMTWSEVSLVCSLVVILLAAMFWPLF
jgi:hypothetical protein